MALNASTHPLPHVEMFASCWPAIEWTSQPAAIDPCAVGIGDDRTFTCVVDTSTVWTGVLLAYVASLLLGCFAFFLAS